MTFLDLFAGIGGFRYGMELAGHKCIGFCECDKYAVASYTAMHLLTASQLECIKRIPSSKRRNGSVNLRVRQKEILREEYRKEEWYADDIQTIDVCSLPRVDCWCFGFPCQDVSIAGAGLGFRGRQSSLFFSVTKLIENIKKKDRPKYLFLENVKNLLSINRGFDFVKLLIKLDEVGYDAEWEILNSKDFGVPQHRERLFLIAHLRGECTRKVFPLQGADKISNTIEYDKVSTIPIAIPVITPNRKEKRQNGRRFKENGDPMFTLTRQDRHGIVIIQDIGTEKEIRIRSLTPLECFRLQGWTDKYFYRAALVNNDNQLYKQAGNSVTVNVIKAIAEKM